MKFSWGENGLVIKGTFALVVRFARKFASTSDSDFFATCPNYVHVEFMLKKVRKKGRDNEDSLHSECVPKSGMMVVCWAAAEVYICVINLLTDPENSQRLFRVCCDHLYQLFIFCFTSLLAIQIP